MLVESTHGNMDVILGLKLLVGRTSFELFDVGSCKSLHVPVFDQLVLPDEELPGVAAHVHIEVAEVECDDCSNDQKSISY